MLQHEGCQTPRHSSSCAVLQHRVQNDHIHPAKSNPAERFGLGTHSSESTLLDEEFVQGRLPTMLELLVMQRDDTMIDFARDSSRRSVNQLTWRHTVLDLPHEVALAREAFHHTHVVMASLPIHDEQPLRYPSSGCPIARHTASIRGRHGSECVTMGNATAPKLRFTTHESLVLTHV